MADTGIAKETDTAARVAKMIQAQMDADLRAAANEMKAERLKYGARFRQKFTLEDAIGSPRLLA
jgi:hypothetical protein